MMGGDTDLFFLLANGLSRPEIATFRHANGEHADACLVWLMAKEFEVKSEASWLDALWLEVPLFSVPQLGNSRVGI